MTTIVPTPTPTRPQFKKSISLYSLVTRSPYIQSARPTPARFSNLPDDTAIVTNFNNESKPKVHPPPYTAHPHRGISTFPGARPSPSIETSNSGSKNNRHDLDVDGFQTPHSSKPCQKVWLCSPPRLASPSSPRVKPKSTSRRPFITRSTSTGRLGHEFDQEGRIICISVHSERVLNRAIEYTEIPKLSRSMSAQYETISKNKEMERDNVKEMEKGSLNWPRGRKLPKRSLTTGIIEGIKTLNASAERLTCVKEISADERNGWLITCKA
ncbi:hypothetical protein BCR39DRAFT_551231 [Naematelia encephala]|uniref:Uncharacterized protein n=1 Tax=Naematelia encephala TaxID=71784 RepID=A0A1Y2AJA3_9TREE|nr:hypothetical protein BCR39DRAFT_551231 [Naematelia encephala]